MYAVVGVVTIDPSRIEEADKELNERVVPTVSGAKGFVSGIWVHSDAGKGVGVTSFETEEDAKAFVAQMQSMPMPAEAPVTVQSMEVFRVVATAWPKTVAALVDS